MEPKLIFTSHPALVRFNGMTLSQIRAELVAVQMRVANETLARVLGIIPANPVRNSGGVQCAR